MLADYAMDARLSRGRRYPEPQHSYRNDYARDRDRVIHSRAFRRLEAKTQVFTTRFSDHFRNRLTHTLEVAQIARTVAATLGLNTDLTEALALVHDIGHPPFGHAGEKQLDLRLREFGERFNHNLHALYIVEHFEQRYLDFPGLNLTFEVREGIIKHSRDYTAAEHPELAEYLLEIAYNTADLDDGYEAHLIHLPELRADVPLFGHAYAEIDRRYPAGKEKLKFNEALKQVLDQLATDLIENTRQQIKEAGLKSVEDVRHHPKRLVTFSPEAAKQNGALKRFLFSRLYSEPAIAEDRDRSITALDELFTFFLDHPDQMPAQYAEQARHAPRHRIVCDYIAGMTDHFLLRQRRELLGVTAEP